MALKVKAVERLLKFSNKPNDPGVYRYVMKPEMYSSLTQAKVIKAWATEGHSVALPGLGSMRFGLRSKAVENVNDVKTSLISSRRIIFTSSVDLKDELANAAIQITCIDRNGKEVKRVTSSDDGNVEDDENGSQNENDNENQNGNQNQNTGGNGGGNTGSITPGGGDEG